jgi:hypothetical protein
LLQFIIEPSPRVEQIDSYSLGYMTVTGEYGEASSKKSGQSIMILLSMIELMDDVSDFLNDTETKKYRFIAIDSSFRFVIRKRESNKISIYYKRRKLDTTSELQLVSSIYDCVSNFYNKYHNTIDTRDRISEDLCKSKNDFKNLLTYFESKDITKDIHLTK